MANMVKDLLKEQDKNIDFNEIEYKMFMWFQTSH